MQTINRLIKQQKPHIAKTMAPGTKYQHLARINPKHTKKEDRFKIEDMLIKEEEWKESTADGEQNSIDAAGLEA